MANSEQEQFNLSPHEAFVAAYGCVASYLEQVSRLLRDATEVLRQSQPSWRMLRQNKDRYMGTLDPVASDSSKWLPDHLFGFYGPGPEGYGTPASAMPKVAFIGAVLGPASADRLPELHLGWVEEYAREDIERGVETHLPKIYRALDPDRSGDEAKTAISSIDGLSWRPLHTLEGEESGMRITLRRVPMFRLPDREAIKRLMHSLHTALSS